MPRIEGHYETVEGVPIVEASSVPGSGFVFVAEIGRTEAGEVGGGQSAAS